MQWKTYALTYGAMGFAVLAKGPVGFVLPTAVIGLYLLAINSPATSLVDSQQSPAGLWPGLKQAIRWLLRTLSPSRIVRVGWAMRPLTALAALALVALPWYLAVGIETNWAWPAGFFWRHNVARFAHPLEGHHGTPFFHLVSIAAGFFPASVFLLPMGVHAFRRIKEDAPIRRGYVLAVCWIAVYLIVFSLCGTKLPSYVTPTYPALALLTGALLCEWTAAGNRANRLWKSIPLSVFGIASVALTLTTALLASGALQSWSTALRLSEPNRQMVAKVSGYVANQWSLLPLGLIPIAGAVFCLAMIRLRRLTAVAAGFVVAATLYSAVMFGNVLEQFDQFQESAEIAKILRQPDGSLPGLASYQVIRPSWVFYSRHRLEQLVEPTAAAAWLKSDEPNYLVVEQSRMAELSPLLPAEVNVVGRVPRFFKLGTLLVLGRANTRSPQLERTAVGKRDFTRR